MRDIINATIGTDHFLKCDTYALARNGEGLTPCLSITIPEGLLEYWAYIDFKKANGETFKTPRLDYVEGKIVYDIDGSVLDTEGKLEVQVVFQNANNEIWKTYVKEFAVRYSINATDDIPNKQDFITEAQKLLDELSEVGGGSGGTTNYEKLSNKPSINGVELVGNKTTSELGINIPTIPTKLSEFENDKGYIDNTALDKYYTKDEVDTLVGDIETLLGGI